MLPLSRTPRMDKALGNARTRASKYVAYRGYYFGQQPRHARRATTTNGVPAAISLFTIGAQWRTTDYRHEALVSCFIAASLAISIGRDFIFAPGRAAIELPFAALLMITGSS